MAADLTLNESDPSQSRSASTADQLRAHILRGLILPGEHLGQAELATRFNMSKVPVREALKQLSTEGLLRHDHNRGYFVSVLASDEAMQLYKMRRWVEAELLRTARWPTESEMTDLRSQLALVSRPLSREDREHWLGALTHLRKTIFDLSPQKTLLREALRLWTLTDRYRSILPSDKSAAGELSLIEALEACNRDQLLIAYHASRDRIESILEEALEMMAT